jgi:hypothetical protein
MGLPVPSTSAELTDRLYQENLLSRPSDPLFATDGSLKEWNKAWVEVIVQRVHGLTIPGLACGDLQNFLLAELLVIGLDDTRSVGRYYCLCSDQWLARRQMRHCWGCHECQPKDSWHCGQCKICVIGASRACDGCGGVSEKYRKRRRD